MEAKELINVEERQLNKDYEKLNKPVNFVNQNP